MSFSATGKTEDSKTGIIRFGPFAVALDTHALMLDGIKVLIQEQPFQILLTLLESPGIVVTREELRRRLWDEETFVDFDQSLNSAVRRLRAALGDNPKSPLYIETIPRIGFRFRAQVDHAAAGEHSPAPPHRIASAPRLSLFAQAASRVRMGFSTAAVFATAMVLGFLFATPTRLQSVHPEKAQPSISGPGRSSRTGTADRHFATQPDFPASIPANLGTVLFNPRRPRPANPALQANSVEMANLEGRYLLSLRNVQSYQRASQAFRRALSLDPSSTTALVGLAQVHVLLSLEGEDSVRHTADAMAFAQRALQLDPDLASAHAALAAARVLKERNFAAATEEFQRAIALDPRDSLSHLWYAMFVLVPEKRYAQAEQQVKRAIELEPFSLIARTDLGWIYANEGRLNAALDQYSAVLRMNPDFVPTRFRMAQLLEQHGRHRQARLFQPSDPALAAHPRTLGSFYGSGASTAMADPCNLAATALHRHAPNSAQLVQTALELHCPVFLYADQDPGVAGVRKDPHFAELARSLHLPEK